MPYPDRLLNEGESKVLDLHPHWFFFVRSIGALVVALVLAGLVLANDLPGAVDAIVGVLVLLALGWFAVDYARWATTNFVVTSDRLIYRHGVIAKHGIEIPLERVNTVFFSQSIFERMLGTGDLTIESAGERGTQAFSNVRKPSEVQNEIYRQMEANENRKFDRVRAPAPPGPVAPPAPSIPDQIAQLDELRRQGLLSDQEFQDKKAELLRRM
ncbi:MAG: PH domain-containing protein [Acidimicrobiia bacterium]